MEAIKKSWPIFICATLLSASPATLAGDGNGVVYGAGTESCGKWLSERDKREWHWMGQWMLGYISAWSLHSNRNMPRKLDSMAFAAFADKYCRENPLADFQDAVNTLAESLSDTKQ